MTTPSMSPPAAGLTSDERAAQGDRCRWDRAASDRLLHRVAASPCRSRTAMSGRRSRREWQLRAGENEGRGPKSNRRRITAAVIIALAVAAAAIIAVVAFAGRGTVEKTSAPARAAASGQASGPFRAVLANGTQFTSRDLVGKP